MLFKWNWVDMVVEGGNQKRMKTLG